MGKENNEKQMDGLVLELMSEKDMNTLIEINKLQEVTNPTYMVGGFPTKDGLLSFEIFGSTVADRKIKMAYIDLKGHYMQPLAALKLKTFDSRLNDILYGLESYRLEKGELIQDDEGQTGTEFLYSIWDKVNKKIKSSIMTEEIRQTFMLPRDELFLTKFLVLPAAFRDIKTGTVTIGMNSINDVYAQILAYVNNVTTYTEGFDGSMTTITRGRIQSLLVNIYQEFMIKKIKGQPSKYGFLKKNIRSAAPDYTSRAVIAAIDRNVESVEHMQIRFGQIGLPLAQVCSTLHPFMVFGLKRYFDNEFVRAGKYPYRDKKSGEVKYCTIYRSYDEEEIAKMIDNYISTPNCRFDPIYIPHNDSGKDLKMYITGRLHKEKTTLSRPATLTDVFYIVALEVCKNKYDYTTRYPLETLDGQFTGSVVPLSTKVTEEITIGDKFYAFFPTVQGNPENAFMDVEMFSNGMHLKLGSDFDGDQLSNKVAFSAEANMEAKMNTESIAYLIDSNGEYMRSVSKEFILTAYMLTNTKDRELLSDLNLKTPEVII